MDFGSQPTLLRCILDAAPGSYREIHRLSREAAAIAREFMDQRWQYLGKVKAALWMSICGILRWRRSLLDKIIMRISIGERFMPDMFRQCVYAEGNVYGFSMDVYANWVGDVLELRYASGDATVTWVVCRKGSANIHGDTFAVDIHKYIVPARINFWYYSSNGDSQTCLASDILIERPGENVRLVQFEYITYTKNTMKPANARLVRVLPRPQVNPSDGAGRSRGWA